MANRPLIVFHWLQWLLYIHTPTTGYEFTSIAILNVLTLLAVFLYSMTSHITGYNTKTPKLFSLFPHADYSLVFPTKKLCFLCLLLNDSWFDLQNAFIFIFILFLFSIKSLDLTWVLFIFLDSSSFLTLQGDSNRWLTLVKKIKQFWNTDFYPYQDYLKLKLVTNV